MYAAAEGHSNLGIPEAVGKEFVRADGEPTDAQIEAGNYPKEHLSFHGLDITIETPEGEERSKMAPDGTEWSVIMPAAYGYIRRTTGADDEQLDCYVGPDLESERVWIVHQNDLGTGEFDEHKVMLGFPSRAAALETYEAGFSDGRGAERVGKVTPSTIAGLKAAIAGDEFRADAATAELTDHQTAEAIRDGDLPSPQQYGDFWLFDLRITGTGAAYRDSLDEYAIRDPELWCGQDFIDRCNGLTVTFGHPERAGLNHQEFQERAVGSIVLPYRKGDEVRGVAKIFDADAAALMQTTHRSTSPGVTPPKGSEAIVLKDGTKVLAEGLPLILDHLAICEAGVWDKDGPPDGVRLDSRKDHAVTEAELEKVTKERDDAKDEEESEREAVAKAEREEAEKKDARRKRHDCERMDGESDADWEKRKADARKDETEEEREEREKRERDDKAKKDAAPVKEVDANRGMKLDAKKVADLEKSHAELEAEVRRLREGHAALTRQPSIEDGNALAAAFHRADNVYQMLGEQTPRHYPGESPIAYRRRLANGLRSHSERWKDYTFHDALDAHAFELVENAIYDDAIAAAKNPTRVSGGAMVLRENKTERNGKTYTEFIGDARAAWIPFMPPTQTRIVKFNNNPAGVR